MPHDDRPPVETPALDGYLAARDAPRRIPVLELAELFRAATREPLADDGELQPHLRITLWRFARALASGLGCLAEDESIEQAMDGIEPCPWTDHLVPRPTPSQRALLRAGATSALYRLVTADGGLCLLPPADGARAATWCAAFRQVADDLAMVRAPRGPDCVRVLGDPQAAAQVACPPRALMELEELIADQALRVLSRHGEAAVVDHFLEKYGMGRREGLGLVALARARALRYGRSSIEDDRALMSSMLKDYLARARETLNLGDELRALRELARVQGLTRTEPEDREGSILDVIRRVGERQDSSMRLTVGAAELAIGPPLEAPAEPRDVEPEYAPRRITSLEAAEIEEFDAAERGEE